MCWKRHPFSELEWAKTYSTSEVTTLILTRWRKSWPHLLPGSCLLHLCSSASPESKGLLLWLQKKKPWEFTLSVNENFEEVFLSIDHERCTCFWWDWLMLEKWDSDRMETVSFSPSSGLPVGQDLCTHELLVRNSAVSLMCTVAPWPLVRWHPMGTLNSQVMNSKVQLAARIVSV